MSYKEIGTLYHYADSYLTLIGTLCAVSNGAGRIFWGRLYEKVAFKKLYSLILIGQSLLPLTLRLVAPYKAFFGMWVVSTLFFTGASTPIFAPLCVSVFGMK